MPVSRDEAVQGVDWQQNLRRGRGSRPWPDLDAFGCTVLSREPTVLGMPVRWHLLWLSLTIMGQENRTPK